MVYDLIIVGGSAAASSAAVYAARRGLNFKVITAEFGGEVATSGEIGNWLGVPETDGFSLAKKFRAHLDHYNVEVEEGVWVTGVKKLENGNFCISAKKGSKPEAGEKLGTDPNGAPVCDYEARVVILTTGVHPRELDVPGEKEFRNKGVTYCTTCDGPLFQGKVATTVGGGNSALESALMMSDLASKVYVINKNDHFKGEQIMIDKLKAKNNVEIVYNAMTSEVIGEQFVTGLKYKSEDGAEQEIATDGVLVHIGMIPNSDVVGEEVEKDEFGYIKVDQNAATNVPGLYAAGDVTTVPYNQIVIAAGQGTIALLSAVDYLNKLGS